MCSVVVQLCASIAGMHELSFATKWVCLGCWTEAMLAGPAARSGAWLAALAIIAGPLSLARAQQQCPPAQEHNSNAPWPARPPPQLVCSGYSGAQLANLVNMAATVASQRGSDQICQQDIEKVGAAVGTPVAPHALACLYCRPWNLSGWAPSSVRLPRAWRWSAERCLLSAHLRRMHALEAERLSGSPNSAQLACS